MENKKAALASFKTKAESSSSAPKKDEEEPGETLEYHPDEAAAGSSPAVTQDELPPDEPFPQFTVPIDNTAGRVGAFHVGGRYANTVNDEWLTSEEDSSESGSEPNDRTTTTAMEQGMIDPAAPYHATSAVLVDESEREQEIETAVQEYIRNNPNRCTVTQGRHDAPSILVESATIVPGGNFSPSESDPRSKALVPTIVSYIQKRRRCWSLGSLLLVTVLLVIVIIAIVLSNQKDVATDASGNVTTAVAPSISPTHSFPTFERSLPPSLVPSTSMAPSLSPIRISTRQELLDVVDDYLARIMAKNQDPVQTQQQQPDMMMGHWDVSAITNFSSVFSARRNPNASIFHHSSVSLWDVSNGVDFRWMFRSTQFFNQDLSQWNTSNALTMRGLFNNATSFNQDLNQWDVSNVVNMRWLFGDAHAFHQNLVNWTTSNVRDMSSVFHQAYAFNGDISTWDTSNVVTMNRMFGDARSFDSDISNWNVANVQNMASVFSGATSFSAPGGGLLRWNTSSATTMQSMFQKAASFNADVSTFSTSRVQSMAWMFSQAVSFNRDISTWDTSQTTDMQYMLEGVALFNQDVSSWNVTRVENIIGMFAGANDFDQNLCPWRNLLPTSVRIKDSIGQPNVFEDTSCPRQENPVMAMEDKSSGPFCHTCNG